MCKDVTEFAACCPFSPLKSNFKAWGQHFSVCKTVILEKYGTENSKLFCICEKLRKLLLQLLPSKMTKKEKFIVEDYGRNRFMASV